MGELVGTRVLRKEDPRLLAGRGRFGADVHRTRTLHVRIVRSSAAAGRILGVNTDAAHDVAGVVAILTAADLPEDLRIPVRLVVQGIDLSEHLQPVLASTHVRYVGEPVAVVVAEDAYAAEDGAELVEVDIEAEEVLLHAETVARLAGAQGAPAGQ